MTAEVCYLVGTSLNVRKNNFPEVYWPCAAKEKKLKIKNIFLLTTVNMKYVVLLKKVSVRH